MADTSWAWREGWEEAWQPVIDLIGEDFSEGEQISSADNVERTSIRRYLEPLELGCPLHYDEAVAKALRSRLGSSRHRRIIAATAATHHDDRDGDH